MSTIIRRRGESAFAFAFTLTVAVAITIINILGIRIFWLQRGRPSPVALRRRASPPLERASTPSPSLASVSLSFHHFVVTATGRAARSAVAVAFTVASTGLECGGRCRRRSRGSTSSTSIVAPNSRRRIFGPLKRMLAHKHGRKSHRTDLNTQSIAFKHPAMPDEFM